MLSGLGTGFDEAFENWRKAVMGAGWGAFHLEPID